MKILLAEDDAALRESLTRQLGLLGHTVTPFPNGAPMCDAIRRGETADLIWSDLVMPEVDGFEVMKVARSFLPNVPRLVVSGHADAELLRRLLSSGGVHFLPKPFTAPELREMLRRIEAIRFAEREEDRAWRSLTTCHFELAVPPDRTLADALANLMQNHARGFLSDNALEGLRLAVYEVIINAIEHGCLEITRDEKLAALRKNSFDALLRDRRADPRFADRIVRVTFEAKQGEGVTVRVEDAGPGFDPSSLPDPRDPENLFLPSGKGVTCARLAVDDLAYEDGGRVAIIRVFPAGSAQ